MNAAVPMMDELIKEYLLFRGFTGTLRAFEADLRMDRDKGFQVDRIIDQLFAYIAAFDIVGLRQFWGHLDMRFFARLDHSFFASVRKLEICLQRYYVVHAIQSGKPDKVVEFFDKFSAELLTQPDWRDWFAILFVKNPELTPVFEGFFTRQWLETFTLSLHNFLSTIFQSMPMPTLLTFSAERIRRKALEKEVETLRSHLHVRREFDSVRANDPRQSSPKGPAQAVSATPARTAPSAKTSAQSHAADDPHRKDILAAMWDDSSSSIDSLTTPKRQNVGMAPPAAVASTPSSQQAPASTAPSSTTTTTTTNATTSDETVYELQDFKPSHGGADDAASLMPPSEEPTEPARADGEGLLVTAADTYREHKAAVTHVRFSSEGTTVASADRAGVLKVWSAAGTTFTTHATLPCPADILSMEWESKSDRLLLLGLADGTIKLFNTDTRKAMFDLTVDPQYPRIVELACSPLGTSFVCSAASAAKPSEGQLLLWNLKTMKLERSLVLEPAPTRINSARYNHNGSLLVTGAEDGCIRVFDMSSQQAIMVWTAHEGEVYSVQFSFDETSVFSLGADGKFRQWNLHTEAKITEIAVPVMPAQSEFMPGAGQFAMDGEGDFFTLASSEQAPVYRVGEANPLKTLTGHTRTIASVAWCSSLLTCATGSADSTVRIYRLCRT
ncbi:WD repeat-containing protein 91 [Capsaspora owczarzaki ATCC 30864]|uniref:WD repeat-containing protein 91 n=1 Tax=Capsaspora owczarzaki (strain ATCC 30864) TaxID=595528 RepID=A0A0D2X4I7_CAPO3|nr:WD repeat-containing protein 91 [Capsaspora owczarzaki ATCC 30864]KJE96129.1 WD repeat-containing protein 91 [Capsaspora owczarzaki ATCC 30864]|eukprot:XP_004345245.2 WD repeat-containing protein 91 [Capsaspora owczarzaki ATCC 30864]